MNDVVVMKFGGTSLNTSEQRKMAATRIIEIKESGKNPVVVVSAMGRLDDSYSTDTLLRVLRNANPNCNALHLDMIASCGEIISAAIVAETLRYMGYEAVALNAGQAGILSDARHGDANIVAIEADKIQNWLKKGYIAIIAGFQGLSEEGFLTTLGRGGSDFTAVSLAKALETDRVYILKDVPGVLTADPKITSKARLIESMTYEELYEMSRSGAKVMNFKAVSSAMENGIDLIVKSLDSPLGEKGTTISHGREDIPRKTSKRLLTAIVCKGNLIQYVIEESNKEIIGSLLNGLYESEISIDMINIGEGKQLFAIDENDRDSTESILRDMDIPFNKRTGCSKLTIVGQAIHGVPGVMSRLMTALNSIDVEIFQTSDSHTTISCIINSEKSSKATEKLHDVFNL